VPVTITEITLEPHASIDQEIPSSYNGFVFTLRGLIQAGADNAFLKTGQTGWLDRPQVDGDSLLRVTAGEEGARLVFYAGSRRAIRLFRMGRSSEIRSRTSSGSIRNSKADNSSV
jgi:redox-sensitive bicupin YhaK (pirin superfamily)